VMSGPAVQCVQTEARVEIAVPPGLRQSPCTVVELTLDRPVVAAD